MPGLGVLADEERELAVRRCESALSRVVARQEGVRDLAELRDLDELIQCVETVDAAPSSSAFARAFEPSAELRHGTDYRPYRYIASRYIDNPDSVTVCMAKRIG